MQCVLTQKLYFGICELVLFIKCRLLFKTKKVKMFCYFQSIKSTTSTLISYHVIIITKEPHPILFILLSHWTLSSLAKSDNNRLKMAPVNENMSIYNAEFLIHIQWRFFFSLLNLFIQQYLHKKKKSIHISCKMQTKNNKKNNLYTFEQCNNKMTRKKLSFLNF